MNEARHHGRHCGLWCAPTLRFYKMFALDFQYLSLSFLLFCTVLFYPIPICMSQFDITTRISILSPVHPLPGFITLLCVAYRERARGDLRSMLGLHTHRPAAGWIGAIDQAQSVCSAILLGLCERRLFLNYYRRQMLVRRCSLSRLDCFSTASQIPSLPLSHFCFLHFHSCCSSSYFLPFLFPPEWSVFDLTYSNIYHIMWLSFMSLTGGLL